MFPYDLLLLISCNTHTEVPTKGRGNASITINRTLPG
uniref:Uncharacterized protein n=1 Tax=Anguilla anguilla TaxID=7936 RepID=A0A0E9TRC2_ANGAN